MSKRGRKIERMRQSIYVLPSLVTTAALFCGFFSVVNSIHGNFITASWLILLAGVFDGLDGRIARLTRTHTDFGIQYDSLCDLASFGMAPALLSYNWTLHHFGKFGWAAAFLFFTCGALRLARFNVQTGKIDKNYFLGLPIPCAAFVLATFVIFQINFRDIPENNLYVSHVMLGMTVALALLMVSTVHYRSFKAVHLNPAQAFFVLVGVAILIFVVASQPSLMLFVLSMGYLISGLVEEGICQARKKNAKVEEAVPAVSPGEVSSSERLRMIHNHKH